MRAKFKKNKNLKPLFLLKKIDSIKNVTDGKVSFSGFEYNDVKIALVSMIEFPSVVDDLDKHQLVSNAMWKAVTNEPTKESDFIAQVNAGIIDALATREEHYCLLTSISSFSIGVRSIKLNDCTIKFYKSVFPHKFKSRRNLIESKGKHNQVESIGYTKVVIELKAKSAQIAAKKALRVLDLFRSMLNLFSNHISEYIGCEWEPINKIRLGEFHTVHRESGEAYPDVFWFDSSYSKARPFVSDNMSVIVKNVKYIMTNLKKLDKKYKDAVTDGLLRYVRAFDEQNQNVAVMRSWGALERVAALNESNCDSVTRRCAFLYEEYEYHKQILEHLREYRNRNVHAGEESNKAKCCGFQIQAYFKALILFHIRNAGYFSDIAEANKYLDLPIKESCLLNHKKNIDKALKFRGYVT